MHEKIKFNEKPIGVDIVKNKNIKKNITFLKSNALKYLRDTNKSFDLILIKQTIHFFSKNQIKELLNLAKKKHVTFYIRPLDWANCFRYCSVWMIQHVGM